MGESAAGNTSASPSLLGWIKQWLAESAGDIVFGMEDGTVSIFGLVFGVAAAVSMMAGVFLDVQTSRGIAKASLASERQEIQNHLGEEKQGVRSRMRAQGFNLEDANAIVAILERNPDAMLQFEAAFELRLGDTAGASRLVNTRQLWWVTCPTASSRRLYPAKPVR